MAMAHVQAASNSIDFSVARPGTNVVLVAEGKEIHVNKELLCSSSPYFNTLLMSPSIVESASQKVNISYNYDILLKCVEIVHGGGPVPTGVTDFELMHSLLEAAEFFELSAVRLFCVTELVPKIDDKDKLSMFHVACHFQLEELKEPLLARLTSEDIRNWVFEGAESRLPPSYDIHVSGVHLNRIFRIALNL